MIGGRGISRAGWMALTAAGVALGACGWASNGPGPRVPTRLAFAVQPTLAESGLPMDPAVKIEIRDAFDFLVADATNAVTVAIGTNSSGGTLAGTTSVAAVHGVATFNNLLIQGIGTGYTLTATVSGLTATTSMPFEIQRRFVAVSTSDNHTCAVTAAGAAYCWGDNSSGQLGDGTTTQRTSPAAVSGGLTFATVSVGGNHTCGLTKAGNAYCWGADHTGQLGFQDSGPDYCTPFYSCSTKPVPVSGGLTFTALSAGISQTCGVTAAGAAYCWGANDAGQLGDGTTMQRIIPTAVTGGVRFATVSAAGVHTCGITTAGAAYCWGDNSHGQLGDGTTTGESRPVAVAGGRTFTAVSAYDNHTCGVTTAGAAYCWGDNAFGELGNGTTDGSMSPTAVSGILTFATVSAGSLHTCGVTTQSAVYCWGGNGDGQLGDGFMFGPETCGPSLDVPFALGCSLAPQQINGGLTFANVTAGGNHVCGVIASEAGWAYCWGDNGFGELGDSSTITRPRPTRVP